MEFVVADNDMPCRYEQTKLIIATLGNFGHDMSKISFVVMKGYNHCEYDHIMDENGNYIFADMIYDFVTRT